MASENRGQPIPKSNIPHHWWYDPRQTGVFTSSPPAHTVYPNSPPDRSWGSSSMSTSPGSTPYSTSPDSKTAIPLPATEGWNKWRRDSLKNFYHLDDFATPE